MEEKKEIGNGTWLSYLPEIYQEDKAGADFLERFLGIFETLYEDMNEKIRRIPQLLEPSRDREKLLYELADWLGIAEKSFWTGGQLYYLVKNAGRLHGIRGTVPCLKEMAALYLGKEPYIVEYHQIQPYFDGGEREALLKRLYASGPYEFTVVFDAFSIDSGSSIKMLDQIIAMVKPAHMACRLAALKPYLFLDRHSYLGINSVLGQYKPLLLDGMCAVPFSVIGDERTIDKKVKRQVEL